MSITKYKSNYRHVSNNSLVPSIVKPVSRYFVDRIVLINVQDIRQKLPHV